MPGNAIFDRLALTGQEFGIEQEDLPKLLTRYAGGHTRKAHPYVSGYFHVILRPPEAIFGGDQEFAQKWFQATCEGHTPPTRSVTFDSIPGLGGANGSDFATGQTVTRTFTLTFREYSGLPIYRAIKKWTNLLDSYVGVSPLEKFIPENYKGECFVLLVRPVGATPDYQIRPEDVEEVYYYDGVVPENEPIDVVANQDLATNATNTISITFRFDGYPVTGDVQEARDKAIELANATKYWDTFTHYINSIGSGSGQGSTQ